MGVGERGGGGKSSAKGAHLGFRETANEEERWKRLIAVRCAAEESAGWSFGRTYVKGRGVRQSEHGIARAGRTDGCRERNRPPLECECNEDAEWDAEERDGAKMRERAE